MSILILPGVEGKLHISLTTLSPYMIVGYLQNVGALMSHTHMGLDALLQG
jgi:hypothetical protein